MKRNHLPLTSLFGAALLSLLLASCASADKPENSDRHEAPGVTLTRPVAGTGKSVYTYPGVIRAATETELSFRVGGQLTDILKMPGDDVRKGDTLMQLDRRDYLDDIRIMEAELAGAGARATKSSADFDRAKKLFSQDVIAKADYDLARSSAASADAAVRNLRAQLSLARHRLDDASLRAPYDGTVTAQLVENHETIRAGQIVMRMHDMSVLEIDCNVPENDIARFRLEKGTKAQLRLPSLNGRIFEAGLREWSTEADKTTRTYKLTFSLPAPEKGGILPGMTAEIVVRGIEPAEPVLTIPFSALAADSEGKSTVWIYDRESETVRPVAVETGAMSDDTQIIVTEGLEGNELVVVEGVHYLSAGMKVTASLPPGSENGRQPPSIPSTKDLR